MARITKESVFEAADKLDSQGQEPSVIAIRDAIGSGSFSTVSKWLKEWRGQQQQQQQQAVTMPDTVQAIYQKAIAAVWAEADRLYREQMAEMRELFAQERMEYAKQADEEIVRLEKRNRELQSINDQLTDKNTALIREAAIAETNANTSTKEAQRLSDKLEALNVDYRDLLKQLGSLEQETRTLKATAQATTAETKPKPRASKTTTTKNKNPKLI